MFFPSRHRAAKVCSSLLLAGAVSVAQAETLSLTAALSLKEVEQIALKQDAGTRSFQYQARALNEQAIAVSSWQDPKLSIGTMNLPGNNPDPLNKGMIELKVEQMLPRGNSNQLQQRKTELQSDLSETAADNRQLQVLQNVRLAWLDSWYWQQALQQLKQDRYLFESLVDVTESMYSQGRKNQQDLYQAEVALTRLDDRIVSFTTRGRQSLTQLQRWTGAGAVDALTTKLPDITPGTISNISPLQNHPQIISAELKIQQAEQDIALAKESYKPQFGIELKYGREQMNAGMDSRNRFSAMVMMDLPLFTDNRQDRQLSASHYRKEAGIALREDTLRQLQGQLDTEQARYQGLMERVALYRSQLLPQVQNQAEAALSAYQSDASSFSDVIQAYKARLNMTIEYIRLQADSRQSAARLQYLLPANDDFQPAEQGEAL
ncbi:TolC family protein [Endozoicomonadaceae bacterium StTr2]